MPPSGSSVSYHLCNISGIALNHHGVSVLRTLWQFVGTSLFRYFLSCFIATQTLNQPPLIPELTRMLKSARRCVGFCVIARALGILPEGGGKRVEGQETGGDSFSLRH